MEQSHSRLLFVDIWKISRELCPIEVTWQHNPYAGV